MQEDDDITLLREFATTHSETAFATLVSRRISFVYSAALRQVRDPHLAQDVTQAVFIVLAQKSQSIREGTNLMGWLFKTTRYAALAQLRAAAKRHRCEKEAQMQNQTATPDCFWEQIAPLLDEALADLGGTDRRAVLLRYFENKSLVEVGRGIGSGEDAARKRVSRALEKLRRFFQKRGIVCAAGIIGAALAANSVQAAPAGLASSITATVVRGATAAASIMTLVKGTIEIMTWIKTKITIAVGIGGLLLVAGAAERFSDSSQFVSPFTRVEFNGKNVTVVYSGADYALNAVNGIPAADIVAFSHSRYGDNWQKRIAEDLLVVFADMGHPFLSKESCDLSLIDSLGRTNIILRAAMSHENRQAVHAALQYGDNTSSRESHELVSDRFQDKSLQVSPFTEIGFNGDVVSVRYNDVGYTLDAVNGVPVADIIRFSRSQYGDNWQKRVAEDLFVTLNDMGHRTADLKTCSLGLIDPKTAQHLSVDSAPLTEANRNKVYQAFHRFDQQ